MADKVTRQYHNAELENLDVLINNLRDQVKTNNSTFDSAGASDFIQTSLSKNVGFKIPENLQSIFNEIPGRGDEHQDNCVRVVKAIMDGINDYETAHGVSVPADLIHQAIHSAYSTTRAGMRSFKFDAMSSSDLSEPVGLQPNRAIVAIYNTFSEAIPFAHYLPTDIGSNKAILAILSHKAGATYGAYSQNGLLDGIYSGERYVSAARTHKCAIDAGTGACTGKLTTIQLTADTCDGTAGDLKTIRGRGVVYVNGKVAAREITSSGSGASTVAGSITIGVITYQIGGSINTDTGVIALTTTPKIPTTNEVIVEGFVDYERQPALVPTIIAGVETFEILASPYRVNTYHGIDARTQMSNELGLDPYSESIMAIQNQYAIERHYEVLRKAKRLAVHNTVVHNLDYAARTGGITRQQMWGELPATIGMASQQMVRDTMNHGITHLYVGKLMAAQLRLLPFDIFEPSGIAERPGIYRIGRLAGQYDVYYEPNKIVSESLTGTGSASILAVGRATDVTRNPFVLGDAVAPIVQPLAMNGDLRMGAGFYARNFTEVNPHNPSALGCAQIDVINIF